MLVNSPVGTCMKNVLGLTGSSQRQMSNRFYEITLQAPSGMCCFHICTQPKLRYATVSGSNTNFCTSIMGLQASRRSCFRSSISKQSSGSHSFKIGSIVTPKSSWKTRLDVSLRSQNMSLRLLVPNQAKNPKIKYNMRPGSWHQRYGPAGLFIGLLVCYSSSEPGHAEAPDGKDNQEDDSGSSSVCFSHGKKVYTDYSVIGIPGDGRCLFRSVAHGACVRSGKPAPNEILQRELADELRAKVADEFVRRREETEWFIEGDFDTYVSQMRKPHVWGGEPELLMASHVLQMPITVYIYDQDSGGLISIAQYGQEYGKDNPIKVLYHGFGHYDALQIPGKKGARPRL